MLRVHTAAIQQRGLYIHTIARLHPDLMEAPLDRQLTSRPRKGPPVAHNLDVYKKSHILHNSAKWKQANVTAGSVRVTDIKLRKTHSEGRFDNTGMYRDWLYGNDRRFVNIIGFLLFVMSTGIFFYTIKFLGSDKWDMPAPLLKKPDLVKRAIEAEQLNANVPKAS